MIYALIALGYTMVYGVLEFINFAHGEVFTIGGFIGATFLIWVGVDDGTPLFAKALYLVAGFVLSVVLTAGLGWLLERVAYRPLRGTSRIIPLLSAIGASIFLQNMVIVVFGSQPVIMPTAVIPAGFITLMGVRVRVLAIAIIVLSMLLMAGLTYLIKATRIGKAMRATSQDREAAEMMGIETNRTISFTFVIGSALAAIGGVLVAMYYGSLKFDTGFLYGLKAFTAAVLGGIGNIPGAVTGSLVLGLAENYGVGLKLGWLAALVAVGLAAGLYVQLWRAPNKRIAILAADGRAEEYREHVLRLYRLAPYHAVKTVLTERRDAVLRMTARHAVRLMIGNVFLAGMLVAFLLNAGFQFSSKWQHAISFIVLMLVLMFRPSGILGDHIQEKV